MSHRLSYVHVRIHTYQKASRHHAAFSSNYHMYGTVTLFAFRKTKSLSFTTPNLLGN